MTQIRIQLTANDFRTLVSGGEVSFDESSIARSKGITFQSSVNDGVAIILEDMGWQDMAMIIEEVWHGDAPERKL